MALLTHKIISSRKLTVPSCQHESLALAILPWILGLNDEDSPNDETHNIDEPVSAIIEESIHETGCDCNSEKCVHLFYFN